MKSTKIKFFINYFKYKRLIKKINNLTFFFPYYCLGGAERVHIDILKVFKNFQPTCFLTDDSKDNFFESEFKNNSDLIEINNLVIKKYQSFFLKALAKKINSFEKPIVFGCNNYFFYDLLPYLNKNVLKIDLLHAFSSEQEITIEKFSLNFIDYLDKRVVLGKKTLKDFEKLYSENNINRKQINKISIIPNKVDIADKICIKYNEPLKVLFVGRNSFEKRPELFLKIAEECYFKNLPFNFSIVGDFKEDIKVTPNVKIYGVVNMKDELNEIFSNHHIILNTSTREGLPMTLLEAMANGVVPIFTNVGEINSVIKNKTNGFIIDDLTIPLWFDFWKKNHKTKKWKIEKPQFECAEYKNTINLFVEKLSELEKNRELLKQMSINSYELIKENYSSEKFENSYKSLFFD